ncbi:hypothetical protein [Corynebacterium kalidii]
MNNIQRKPARTRHPLAPDNAPGHASDDTGSKNQDAVQGRADDSTTEDPYADPMYDTLVNLQVRVPLRLKLRLEELKKRDGGSIAGHVTTGLSEWLTTKNL